MKNLKLCIVALLLILTSQSLAQADVKTDFWVDGVCGMCEERIEKAALIKGVKSASWDVDSKMLTIEFDKGKVKLHQIHEAISKVGHDTKQAKATQEVYDNLHGCCKYRDEEIIADHAPIEPEYVLLNGKVLEKNEKGKKSAVFSANV
ncbi:MAG: mercuric ion binding protein, partial [Urechidicola sp.]